MRKIFLTYGLIAGLIVTLLIVITWSIVPPEGDFAMSYVVGYASMIIALTMIYFAIRTYRDNELGGIITWKRGFLVGVYVSIIASVLYVIGWKIFSSIAMPDFWDRYAKHSLDALAKRGASAAEIASQAKELEYYKHMPPLMEWAMTFMEIFPVGLLISAISALILRRKSAAGAVTSNQPVIT
jgi:hypothetical protein